MKPLRPALQTPPSATGVSSVAPSMAAALVWLLLALSVGYWGLRWWGQAPAQLLPATAPAELAIDSRRVASALGALPAGTASGPAVAAQTSMPAASQLRLVGVVSSSKGQGTALIGVGGQAPRPYRVGATVEAGLVLRALGPRHAELGPSLQGPTTRRLELPVASASAGTTVPATQSVAPPAHLMGGAPATRAMPSPAAAD